MSGLILDNKQNISDLIQPSLFSRVVDVLSSSRLYDFIGHSRWLASKSQYFAECRKTPGGYWPLELTYTNKPTGSSWLQKVADFYYLNYPLARAARIRLKIVSLWLRRNAEQLVSVKSKVRVLNLACGGVRETLIAFAQAPWCRSVSYLGIDFDKNAVSYAAQRARRFGLSHFCFRQANALRASLSLHEEFDIIFMIGLLNYLRTSTTIKLLNRLHQLLPKDGKLLFSLALHNPNRRLFERKLNWYMEYRSPEACMALVWSTLFAQTKVLYNCNKCFLLVECTK